MYRINVICTFANWSNNPELYQKIFDVTVKSLNQAEVLSKVFQGLIPEIIEHLEKISLSVETDERLPSWIMQTNGKIFFGLSTFQELQYKKYGIIINKLAKQTEVQL